ncbi:hypothetical protein ScPMuIL_003061 [Solemya velum]
MEIEDLSEKQTQRFDLMEKSEDTVQTIERTGAEASISVQTGQGEIKHATSGSVALIKELVEQGGANVYFQYGETNEVNTVTNIIHEDEKTSRLIDETKTCVKHWNKTDGRLYLPTPSLEKCQKILTEEGHLNIFGLSGQGKTALAYKLIDAPGQSVFLRSPEDWGQVDKEKCKLIILDDLFGRLQLDMVAKKNWFKNFEPIYAYVKERKLKIVTTCRETIFSLCKEELGHYKLFKPESCVHLSDVIVI